MPKWDSAQYLKFGDERTRPAIDLLSQVPAIEIAQAVDLGCGPGNSTILLAERWPHAKIVGIDNSPEMLARARDDHPALQFEPGDLADWTAGRPMDLVYSNAAIQWVGDHNRVLPRLLRQVRPGGVLAVQMPRNEDAPTHALMREVAADPRWRDRLAGVRAIRRVQAPDFYYDLLAPHAARVDLWETEYRHVMGSVDDIVGWVRGTGLRPFLEPLDGAEQAAFIAAYLERLAEAYPIRRDGKVVMPFRRIFFVAVR